MLIKLKAKIPEIFVGVFLTVAVFAMGMAFKSSQNPNQPIQTQSAENPQSKSANSGPQEPSWKDPIVILTLGLLFVAGIQAVLFVIQLGFISTSLKDAKEVAKATTEAAKAADLSARAAIALKLPIIRIWPAKVGHGDSSDGTNIIETCSIYDATLYNLGETKAFPTEIVYGWAVGDNLPPQPKYEWGDKFLPNYFLEPESLKPQPVVVDKKRLTGAKILKVGDWEKICRGNYLWFYCMLIYQDFMDERHTHSFCWKWVGGFAGGAGWVIEKDAAYNQRT